MTKILSGYADIPEADRKKAQVFFGHGRSVGDTGNYDYAIDMYISGLALDPEAVEAHTALHEISLRRKASGGKPLDMFKRMKIAKESKDDKQNMLNFEKLVAYDPGNIEYLVKIVQNAHRAGFYDTVMFWGAILFRANRDAQKTDLKAYLILRDIYKSLNEWKLATDACHEALQLRPGDMALQTEMKNLGAQHTMQKGGYGTGKSFRESVKDVSQQQKLMDEERDVKSVDHLTRSVMDAEREWRGNEEDPGKLTKYIDAMVRTENVDYEEKAIEVLEAYHNKTGQFKYRQRMGEIRLKQMERMERSLAKEAEADPKDKELQQTYREFALERVKTELEEARLVVEAYPTDATAKYRVGQCLFQLKQFQDAIPIFQQVRSDPKYRVIASLLLGRCFLEAGFVDEAAETIKAIMDDYPNKGDDRSRQMYYWYARAMEEKKEFPAALKAYSQLAQWDFNYADVQSRIKRLRSNPS